MPCYYTGSEVGDAKLDSQESRQALTKVTRMLCDTMARLETAKRMNLVGKTARDWWSEHKKQDKKAKAL